MNLSFYTAGTGAKTQQERLDIVSNNIANLSTYGYKTKNASFSDLLYNNIRESGETVSRLRQGCGARVQKTDTLFYEGTRYDTSYTFDFTIIGDGFFAVENPSTNTVSYTRDGSFALSEGLDGNFYLVTGNNDFVLDKNGNRITIQDQDSMPNIGVFDFAIKDGMLSIGGNRFQPTAKNGNPYLVGDAQVERGCLEASNVDMVNEMTKLIKAQRSYQMALRMVQTSDEIENTINSLR